MKINLCNIGVNELIDSVQKAYLFNSNNIYNAHDLYNAIFEKKLVVFNTKQNLEFLKRSYTLVQSSEGKYDFMSELPSFKTFGADEINLGDSLPVLSMHMHFNVNYKKYSLDTIREIKHNLTTVDSKGVLVFEGPMKSLKMRDVRNVIEMVNFYDSYATFIEDNYGSVDDYFLKEDFDIKKDILNQYRVEVVKNLLSMSDSFIFGNISDAQRKEILSGASGLAKGRIKAESLLNIIARYSTLGEILSNPAKSESFKRLVK